MFCDMRENEVSVAGNLNKLSRQKILIQLQNLTIYVLALACSSQSVLINAKIVIKFDLLFVCYLELIDPYSHARVLILGE